MGGLRSRSENLWLEYKCVGSVKIFPSFSLYFISGNICINTAIPLFTHTSGISIEKKGLGNTKAGGSRVRNTCFAESLSYLLLLPLLSSVTLCLLEEQGCLYTDVEVPQRLNFACIIREENCAVLASDV